MIVRANERTKSRISEKRPAVKYAMIALVIMIAATVAVQLVPGVTENSEAADIAIDLSSPASEDGADWNGVTDTLTFSSPLANDNIYTLTGGGGAVMDIIFQAGVTTTVIIENIDIEGMIELQGDADVTLLLSGDNMIAGSIVVPSTATITIDSAGTRGSSDGSLTADGTSNAGYAGIGGGPGSGAGTIIIDGGTVTAVGGAGAAGIGGGAGGAGAALTIDGAADIKAYSSGELPAIHADSVTGGGFFVNVVFTAGLANQSTFGVYIEDTKVAELVLPAGYRSFAFQEPSSSAASEDYSIYLLDLTGVKKKMQVVCESDKSPAIYSVNTSNGYGGDASLSAELQTMYIDVNGGTKTHEAIVLTQTDLDAAATDDSTNVFYELDDSGPSGGWFVIESDIFIPEDIVGSETIFTIEGDVRIIIANGVTFTVECIDGIEVLNGNLWIYSQPEDGTAIGVMSVTQHGIHFTGGDHTFVNTAYLDTSVTMEGISSVVTNGVTGTIQCSLDQTGITFYTAGDVLNNYGTIIGDAYGVYMGDDGIVNNYAAPFFYPGDDVLYGEFPSSYRGTIQSINGSGIELILGGFVNNYGGITGDGSVSSNAGIFAHEDATVNNYAGGTIVSAMNGLYLLLGGTVSNYGEITGNGVTPNNAGIYSADDITVINNAGGAIKGARYGINFTGGTSTADNYGLIEGTGSGSQGIHASDGTAIITNHEADATGDPVGESTIKGSEAGIYLANTTGSQISNAGMIVGSDYGVQCVDNAVTLVNSGEIRGDVLLAAAVNSVTFTIGSHIEGDFDMSDSVGNSTLHFRGTDTLLELGLNMTFSTVNGSVDIGNGAVKVTLDTGVVPWDHDLDMVILIDAVTADGTPAPPATDKGYNISIISSDGDLVADPAYVINYNVNGGSGGPASMRVGNGIFPLSSTVPTHAEEKGYDVLFMGWTLDASIVGKILKKGGTVPALAANVIVIGANVTLYAVWVSDEDGNNVPDVKNYNITASAGTGTSISPSGTVVVPGGGNRTFSFSADAGYYISAVTVDGKNLSQAEIGLGYYTFAKVSANHTIQVSGSAGAGITLTISVVEGKGHAEYSINGNDFQLYNAPVPIPMHGDVSLRAFADDGYEFSGWGDAGNIYREADYSLYDRTESLYLELHFIGDGSGSDKGSCLWWILLIIVLLIILILLWFFLVYRRYYDVIKVGHSAEIVGANRAHRKSVYTFSVEGGPPGTVSYRIGEDGEWKIVLPDQDGKYFIPRGEITDAVTIEQR